MTNNFINVDVSRNNDRRKPTCFGDQWEEDDWNQCRKCDFFFECGSEFKARHGSYVNNTYVPPRSSYYHRTTQGTTAANRTTVGAQVQRAATTLPDANQVVRPKTPEGYPMGTEYLPPERAGKSSAVERFVAKAQTEMVSAAAQQLGHSLIQFFRDPANYNAAAGQWKYGDNYHGQKKVKYGFKFKKPAEEEQDPNPQVEQDPDKNPKF